MPSEVRIDKGYLARSLAVLVLCLAVTSVLVFWGIQDGQPSPTWGLALAAAIIVGFVLIARVIMWPYFFVYRCPICQDRLPRMASRGVGVAVRYHCERCNIEWDLFIRPGDGS